MTQPPVAPDRTPYTGSGRWFALFLAAGLVSTLVAAVTRLPDAPRPGLDEWLDGRATQALATALGDTPLPHAAARLERGLSWLAVGDLGPRVRQGCPGWLFLADELAVHRDAQANAAARAAEVRRVRDALAERDIALLVAVVPDKSRVASAQRCGVVRPASLDGRVAAWVAQLGDVPVLDLASAMAADGQAAFLRTDTHWSEAGAAAAAQAVAERARAVAPGLPAPSLRLQAVPGAPVPRPGDLIRLAGIAWLPASLQPPADIVRPSRFVEDTRGDGPANADDLFGDTGLPGVALLGTSFSRNGNFVPFLERALGQRIGNFARDGAEFAGAASAYFGGAAWRDAPPRLVVWEIPERALQAPRRGEAAITVAPR